MPETLLVDIRDRVATITLNRPDRLNAYTTQMGVELFSTLDRLDGDDEVRAIVITGAGRAFCAGADLATDGSTFAGDESFRVPPEVQMRTRPWNMRTPILAAINGPAVGIGATLPLQWDIRIASDKARIGFVFTRRGIIPEAMSTWILPRLVGFGAAMDLLLTARIVDAEEARRLGLVSRVVPHDQLLDVARELALDIARNTAPVPTAITRRLLWRQLMESDVRRGADAEEQIFRWIGKQPDAAEGVKSFLEKREPRWTMRASTDIPPSLGELKE